MTELRFAMLCSIAKAMPYSIDRPHSLLKSESLRGFLHLGEEELEPT